MSELDDILIKLCEEYDPEDVQAALDNVPYFKRQSDEKAEWWDKLNKEKHERDYEDAHSRMEFLSRVRETKMYRLFISFASEGKTSIIACYMNREDIKIGQREIYYAEIGLDMRTAVQWLRSEGFVKPRNNEINKLHSDMVVMIDPIFMRRFMRRRKREIAKNRKAFWFLNEPYSWTTHRD